MRRVTALFVLIALVAVAAVGQDAPTADVTTGDSSDITLDLGAHYTASVFTGLWGVNVSGVYQLGALGAGGGLKSFFGVGHEAVYLAPYGRLELGWLYFGLGPLVLLQQPTDSGWASPATPVTFLGTAGMGIPLIPVGPGYLGLDLGTDLSVTPFPVPDAESTGNIIADFFAAIATGTVAAVVNTFKVSGGVFYTVGL